MSDDNQIFLPPSFLALYTDARQRLREPLQAVRERYDICEDLAQLLVEQARTLAHGDVPSDDTLLRRIHAGLSAPGAGVSPEEAQWVVTRLAELLDWPIPKLADGG